MPKPREDAPKKGEEPPKSEPSEPKSEPEAPKSEPEPEPEKPKEGTPEYKRWKGERIAEGLRKAKEREMTEDEPEIPKRELRAKTEPAEQRDERGKKETDLGGIALGLALGAVVVIALVWMLRNREKKAGAIDTTATPAPEPAPAPTPEAPPRQGARSMLEAAEDESPWGSVLRP